MRTVKIDYSSVSPKVSYDGSAIGIQGEHRASELVIVPPPDMPPGLEYRLAFDPGGMSDTLSLTNGELRYELPQSITRHEVVSMNIEGYEGGNRIYKSVMVELYFDEAVDTDNPVDADRHSIGAEVAENTAARHTHSNKDTLDKLSVSNGKLQYNGSDVGLKGDKGDKGDPGSDANVTKANVITALGYTPEAVSAQVTTGTEITLADNTEYRLTDVTTLTLTYPAGDFESWMRLTFAASGTITVTLPAETKYIGTTPTFANGETWELSIKDGVVIAQRVGDGT